MEIRYGIRPIAVPKQRCIGKENTELYERPMHNICYSEYNSNYIENLIELSKEDYKFLIGIKCVEEEENFKKMIIVLEDESHLRNDISFTNFEESFRTILPNIKQTKYQKIFNVNSVIN